MSRSGQAGGVAPACPRGGEGSAAMVPAVPWSADFFAAEVISARARAARSAMSSSMSPKPPVRSAFSGAVAAATLASTVQRSSSIAAISAVL